MRESGVGTDWEGLAARIRRGDVAAFNALYITLFEPLVEFAYQYVHDIAMAEDIVQDVFQSYWVARTEREVHGLRIYLYSAVKKRVLNQRRHARVVQLAVVRSDIEEPLGHSEAARDPNETVDSNDLRKVLNRVLAELPEARRRVVLLRWKHQMSYPEIAQLLHISVSAAQAQVSRVQRSIRPLLKRFLEEE
jgi:RNA polymerase sigma-70 factor (ECF subfamily)